MSASLALTMNRASLERDVRQAALTSVSGVTVNVGDDWIIIIRSFHAFHFPAASAVTLLIPIYFAEFSLQGE